MKSTLIKKATVLLLAGAMCAGMFAGCGTAEAPATSSGDAAPAPAQSTAEPAAAEAAEGETTIRVAWWGNQLRNDGTVAMLDAFVTENPGVKYEAEFSDWSGYWDKLATQAASSNLPDIIQQDYAYINQYHASGQLASLTAQIDAGNLNVGDVSQSILDVGSFNGELFALCAGVNAVGMLYNTEGAEQAGIEVPLRMTYEELMDMNAKVFAATGMPGMTPGGEGSLQMMCRNAGELYLNPEDNTIGASEATVRKYFDQIEATITSDWALPVEIMQEDSTAGVENSSISTKRCWNAFPGGSNQMAAHQAPMGGTKLGFVMYPTTSDATQENMYLRPAMFWSITESSANKDISAKIIDFYTNSEAAQDVLLAERGVPVSAAMSAYLAPKLDEVQQEVFKYIDEVTKVAVPFDPPLPNGSNEVRKLLDDLTDLIRYGELTPEDATARFMSEAPGILTTAAA